MGRNSEESLGGIFFIWSIIFCFATWAIWGHYQTINGPTTLATVVSKSKKWHKGSYDYYLNIRLVHDGLKVATSTLAIEENHYPGFELGDTFPIKYARNSPEDTAFVGEPFYTTFGGVGYGVMVLILVFSFLGMQRENRPSRRPKRHPKPQKPAQYSPIVTLGWAAMGAAIFSGGIVSCRHATGLTSSPAETQAYQFEEAAVVRLQYSAATNYASALVRRLAPADTVPPARLSLSPEQYALLHARLSRPLSKGIQVLVAYPSATPTQVVLADGILPPLPQETKKNTPLGISYSTLGALLSVVGIIFVASNLIKYARRANN